MLQHGAGSSTLWVGSVKRSYLIDFVIDDFKATIACPLTSPASGRDAMDTTAPGQSRLTSSK
jgi:hypothetical protein